MAACAPFVAVVVAVGVGLMQAHLQRQHLRQELFNKRFAIYTAMRDLEDAMFKCQPHQAFTSDAWWKFHRATQSATFLFGFDGLRAVLRADDAAFEFWRFMHDYHQRMEHGGTAPDYAEFNSHYSPAMRAVGGANLLTPYLQLHRWFPWRTQLLYNITSCMESKDKAFQDRYEHQEH